jgi:hypothetical protein
MNYGFVEKKPDNLNKGDYYMMVRFVAENSLLTELN